MKIGLLANTFYQASMQALFGEGKMWRLNEIRALLRGDFSRYVATNSFHFAQEMRQENHQISHTQVWNILHRPDPHYCGNMTPMRFCLTSQENAQIAVLAVRESIREFLGIGLPRMSVTELKQGYTRGTLYER